MTETGENAASDPSPAELTVGDLCRLLARLKPGQLWAIIAALAGVLAATFMFGFKVSELRGPTTATADPILLFQRHSQQQEELRKRDSIAAFEDFLHHAAQEQWSEAYALLASTWKSRIAAADKLSLDYRMTQRHEFHYYIPTSITEDQESYDAEMSYWDFFPALPVRDAVVQEPLGKVLDVAKLGGLADEVTTQLSSCYHVTNSYSSAWTAVSAYLATEMTIRDLVLRDDVIEVLGKRFGYTPIVASETFQGKSPATERRRMFHISLLKEGGKWLVDSYDSYLIEKR